MREFYKKHDRAFNAAYAVLSLIGLLFCWYFGISFKVSWAIALPILVFIFAAYQLGIWIIYLIPIAQRYWQEDGKQFDYRVLETRPEMPSDALALEEELLALGFRPLAAVEGFNPNIEGTETQFWYFLDEAETTVASLIDNERLTVFFVSHYPDNFVQEGIFNDKHWPNVETDSIYAVSIESSLSAAYDYHQQQMSRFTGLHGAPKIIKSIQDYFSQPVELKKSQMKAFYLNQLNHALASAFAFVVYSLGALVGIWAHESFGTLPGFLSYLVILSVYMSIVDVDELTYRFTPIDSQAKRKLGKAKV